MPQDREGFDTGLKAVLDEVRVNLDLGALNDFVHRWWISACDSARDPEGRRRMHARAGEIAAGDAVPKGAPWREVVRVMLASIKRDTPEVPKVEVPSSPHTVPASRIRSALINLGIAVGSLAAGAGATWVIFTYWRLIVGALVVVAALVAFGATAAIRNAHKRAIREQWLREAAHLDRVDVMSGDKFEELVAELLRRDGYRNVEVVGRTGDHGADVTGITPDGRQVAVQCKRWKGTVGVADVRQFIGAIHGVYAGHIGVFVTSSTFTGPATGEGRTKMTLVDRERLASWMDGDELVV